MKILHINKFHYLNGGSERHYFALSKLLAQQGHEALLFNLHVGLLNNILLIFYDVLYFLQINESLLLAIVVNNRVFGYLIEPAAKRGAFDMVNPCPGLDKSVLSKIFGYFLVVDPEVDESENTVKIKLIKLAKSLFIT